MCTLLSGKAPVIGTRRIFLERNNIGDAGAASPVEDLWHSVWHLRPAGSSRRQSMPPCPKLQSTSANQEAGRTKRLYSSRSTASTSRGSPEARWHLEVPVRGQRMPQAAPSFAQPRPISRVLRAGRT